MRITKDHLRFVPTLMARPEMNGHKRDRAPPSADAFAQALTRDIAHWTQLGFDRYVVFCINALNGLCGLTRHDDMTGLNLSYHLSPEYWGIEHASALTPALVDLAPFHLTRHGPLCGLVRPANPASARVLEKAGFTGTGETTFSGARTTRVEWQVIGSQAG